MRVAFPALAIALAIATPAFASHCTTWSTSETDLEKGMIIVPFPTGQTTMYLFVDVCQPDCLFSNWFYEESNGFEGLQRADDVVSDTCHGMIDGDTYIF